VFEIGLGSLFVFSYDRQETVSVKRLASDLNGSVNYFIVDNVSIGLTGLFSYASNGEQNGATAYGAALGGIAHLRLGQGAFFRPGLSLGVLKGNREIPVAMNVVMEASQLGFTARARFPIAYFVSRNLNLEAGPQFNFTAGRYTPDAGDDVSFSSIEGGFSIGLGYAF
jgi:hypothetical protein